MPKKLVKITGGDNIKKHIDKITNLHGYLEVGFLNPETAKKAIINEFGIVIQMTEETTITIPARPFMQQSIDNNTNRWIDLLGKSLVKFNYDLVKALKYLGPAIKSDIQKTIRDGDFVANSPITIAKKGSDKPLIDTGEMLQSVEYEVHG